MLDRPLGLDSGPDASPSTSSVEFSALGDFIFGAFCFFFAEATSECEPDFGASLREDDGTLVKTGAASRDIRAEFDGVKQVTRTKQRVNTGMMMERIFLRKEIYLYDVIWLKWRIVWHQWGGMSDSCLRYSPGRRSVNQDKGRRIWFEKRLIAEWVMKDTELSTARRD